LSLWAKFVSDTKNVKATEQYFLVVLFMLLSKVGQTFECVNEILNCDQMNFNEQNFPLIMSDFQFILCRFFCGQVKFDSRGGEGFTNY